MKPVLKLMWGQKFWQALSFLRALSPSAISKGQVGDGRERALLEQVLSQAEKGNPQSVLQTVDSFAQRTWLMNVGDQKGIILDNAVRACNPRVALELGAYCGYSAVRIACELNMPDSKLVTVEMSPENAEIARKIVEHAGLADKVQVVQGVMSERVAELGKILLELHAQAFDFVFMDHNKNCYLPDLLLLRDNGFLKKGTVVVADNMTIPGSPQYRGYLKSHPEEFESVEHKSRVEYLGWLPDSLIISAYKV